MLLLRYTLSGDKNPLNLNRISYQSGKTEDDTLFVSLPRVVNINLTDKEVIITAIILK